MPHIPQQLDEPFKLIIWPIDEFIVFIIPFFSLFFWCNSPVWGLMLGALSLMGMQRLKGDEGHAFLVAWAYWFLPGVIRFKVIPTPCPRLLLE